MGSCRTKRNKHKGTCHTQENSRHKKQVRASFFSLFKEKSEKPQTRILDSEDDSEEAKSSKPQAVVPDSDDE